jgi:hypothetical protein
VVQLRRRRLGAHAAVRDVAVRPARERQRVLVREQVVPDLAALKATRAAAQLYHLGRDPRQTTNLIEQEPDVAAQLAALLGSYRRKIPAGAPVGWINLRR